MSKENTIVIKLPPPAYKQVCEIAKRQLSRPSSVARTAIAEFLNRELGEASRTV